MPSADLLRSAMLHAVLERPLQPLTQGFFYRQYCVSGLKKRPWRIPHQMQHHCSDSSHREASMLTSRKSLMISCRVVK